MEDIIRNFIVETFMYGEGEVLDDEQLFETGKLDSLGFIKLLTFIGNEFNVHIDMSEVSMEKFSTINDIVKTINDKTSA